MASPSFPTRAHARPRRAVHGLISAASLVLVACASSHDTASPVVDACACGSSDASAGPAPGDASLGPATGDASFDAATTSHATYVLPFRSQPNGLSDGLSLFISVGGGAAHDVMLDTGSEALLVPRASLGSNVAFPSPARPFTLEYTSDGLIFTGEVVTTNVVLGVAESYTGGAVTGLPQTLPMPVQVVEAASCDPSYPNCQVPADLSTVGVLGVGFGRGASDPSANALLQVQDIAQGAMTPGFILSTHPMQLTVGIPASAPGFTRISLAPTQDGGDWLASSLQGCAAIPALSWSLCGSLLVDTGIDYAILAIPSGATTPFDGGVPDGSMVDLLAPQDGGALSDSFQLGGGAAQAPSGVALRKASGGTGAVNTGRRVLAIDDYLFDARAGEVGFRKAE